MRSRQKRRVSRTTEGEADWAIAALHVPEIQTSPAISRLIHALPSPPRRPPLGHVASRGRQVESLLSASRCFCHHLLTRMSSFAQTFRYSGSVLDICN